jgi:hypothetical protein
MATIKGKKMLARMRRGENGMYPCTSLYTFHHGNQYGLKTKNRTTTGSTYTVLGYKPNGIKGSILIETPAHPHLSWHYSPPIKLA